MKVWLLTGLLAATPVCADEPVFYDWFQYIGNDSVLMQDLGAQQFRNPILAGYYPDPSVERVGNTYYLVNSTFTHWPGIPIHVSGDLVHWRLIGHALTDASKYSFDGLNTSRGVFAPSIHHHNGVFYIINTLVDAGGNFFVTAKDPRGPWSDPVWLKEIDGIDPSFFFDNDGKAYIVNNGPPEGKPLYEGHRAIWMQEFDLETNRLVGPRKVIVNGGSDLAKRPIWIEGPHIYRVKDTYYLMCAEGGTERNHSEVIFRSQSPWGPYESFAGNPILTQRDLPPHRKDPVTNAGHADLVEAPDGTWWAVFLASRPYEGHRFNTGRETWLLPVKWKDGWPVILEQGKPVPYVSNGPASLPRGKVQPAHDRLTGTWMPVVEFDGAELGPEWIQVHVPKQKWYDLTGRPGMLTIHPQKVNLDEKRNASFLARRQQHQSFHASTSMLPPNGTGVAAGLAAFQNENYWYFFGIRRHGNGLQVFLERNAGKKPQVVAQVLAPAGQTVQLRISGDGQRYSFWYDTGDGMTSLVKDDDASILSTEIAGGFVGTVLGPFARQE